MHGAAVAHLWEIARNDGGAAARRGGGRIWHNTRSGSGGHVVREEALGPSNGWALRRNVMYFRTALDSDSRKL